MSACVHVCVCVRARARVCAHNIYAHVQHTAHTAMSGSSYTRMYMHKYTCIYAHIYTCVYVCMNTRVCICVHKYTWYDIPQRRRWLRRQCRRPYMHVCIRIIIRVFKHKYHVCVSLYVCVIYHKEGDGCGVNVLVDR